MDSKQEAVLRRSLSSALEHASAQQHSVAFHRRSTSCDHVASPLSLWRPLSRPLVLIIMGPTPPLPWHGLAWPGMARQAVNELTDRKSWRGGLRVSLANGVSVEKALAKLKAAANKKAKQEQRDRLEGKAGVVPDFVLDFPWRMTPRVREQPRKNETAGFFMGFSVDRSLSSVSSVERTVGALTRRERRAHRSFEASFFKVATCYGAVFESRAQNTTPDTFLRRVVCLVRKLHAREAEQTQDHGALGPVPRMVLGWPRMLSPSPAPA